MPKKAKVTSNNHEVAQKIANATGMHLEEVSQIEALGVDIGAGTERRKWRNQTIDKRIKNNKYRVRKIARMRKRIGIDTRNCISGHL